MKKVLLTGASGGLGLALASSLLEEGYFVYLQFCQNKEKLLPLVEKYKGKCALIEADFTCDESVQNFLLEVKKKDINILINNAAIEHLSPLEEKTKETFLKVLEVNTLVPFLLLKELISDVDEVVNISSDNAIDKYDMVSLEYDVSKVSLNMLGHEFAREYPDKKINTLCFGWLDTPMNDFPDDIKEKLSFVSLDKATQKVLEYINTDKTDEIEVVR